MTTLEFCAVVRKCDFLLSWQKERLEAMLCTESCDDRGCSDNSDHDSYPDDVQDIISLAGFLSRRSQLLNALDNVFWRTMGVSIDFLPVGEQRAIEAAVREVSR